MLGEWVEAVWRDERVRALAAALRTGRGAAPAGAGSVYGSAQALLVAALRGRVGGPIVAVAVGVEEADDLLFDLEAFGVPGALRFPAWEALPEREALPNFSIFSERLDVLRRLATDTLPGDSVVIAPAGAILQPVPEADEIRRASIPLRRGEEVPPALLEQALARAGFERVPMVELPGEWSQRGGIVDVFPLAGGGPYRLEYFGDQIDSIREIDPESQRSVRELEALEIALAGAGALFRGADALHRSLLDHLPPAARLVVIEPARVDGMAIELARRFGPRGPYLPAAAWLEGARRFTRLEVSALPLAPPSPAGAGVGAGAGTGAGAGAGEGGDGAAAGGVVVSLETRSVERASGTRLEDIAAGIRALGAGTGTEVTILAPREAEVGRLRELLAEQGLEPGPGEAGDGGTAGLRLALGEVTRGFDAPRLGRALLVSRELFRQALVRRPAPRAARRKAGRPIESFLELAPGDLIVHLVHGIGKFIGVERMETEGRLQEYLALEYAEGTIVYVPATKIGLVQRYVGAKGLAPHLSKIGTAGWQKSKDRVKAAVMDLAAELIEVQAARALRQGFTYPPDDAWQDAFEASFPFDETPDQETAVEAVKEDLAGTRPMDRLVCGDVGYGKTEIAMRAAFKAALAGKQVAVLVPTTILAEQHLETFRSRMSEFPVRVECLNRFRASREVRRIVEATRGGEVDILIGTHRILSEDVAFKDLGLVVIDEEQRFGVAHKERLKRLRKTVDVLTLTATPIPRTLHLSLLGIKDISALETPPEGRLAIETIIARDSPETIREAILRELAREGQVYFVHNRVYSIERRAEELERLVPEARFAVVHGQMDEEALEGRMLAFIRGSVDVLVTTTIIESGLDIPRANTLFVDRADRFGLADLHQLRGRVGRYKHRAYAYLLLPRHEPVSEIAERRLKAIEELSDLGAGFRIAMRDLEIRGAGNILGPEQSGHIAAVGYDLYCRLLRHAVTELKRAPPPATAAEPAGAAGPPEAGARPALAEEALGALLAEGGVEIELNIAAHIPERYVPDARQKIEAYRKLAAAHDVETLAEVEAEFRDRFGPLPEAARALVHLNRLRIACERLSIHRVSAEGKAGVLAYAGDGAALRRQLAYSRTKAIWPEPGTCFAVISEEADLEPEAVLDLLVAALCMPGREEGGEAGEAVRARPAVRRSAPEQARGRRHGG